MKKVRIILSIMAIVFAIAGAVASQATTVAEAGYRFIDNPDPMPDVCQITEIECEGGANTCRLNPSTPLYRQSSITACGVELKRVNP